MLWEVAVALQAKTLLKKNLGNNVSGNDAHFSAKPMLHCFRGKIRKHACEFTCGNWISALIEDMIWLHQGTAGIISLQLSSECWSVRVYVQYLSSAIKSLKTEASM